MRRERGITLIALVITIIILLILTGITIGLTIGQNGILEKAQIAKGENKKTQIKESIQLAIMDIETELSVNQKGETLNSDALIRELPSKLQGIRIENDMTGTYQGYTYYIDENYNVHIEEKSNSPITVEQTIIYVGTSKCTIKVNASSKQGNIVKYQYMINNEIKEEIEENEYTIKNLEPTTKYKVSVIAIDEKGNSEKSIQEEITTKERMYLIKDGKLLIEGETANATITPNEGFLELVTNTTTSRAGYHIRYDITNYQEMKLDAEVISKTSSCSCGILLNPSNPLGTSKDNFLYFAPSGTSTSRERFIESWEDIKDLQGNYYLFCMKNATKSATKAIIHIYNLWLEE